MMQASLLVDRHAASCGGSTSSTENGRRGGLSSLARSVRDLFGRDPARMPADPLDDRLLQDIGLSRADLQALSL